MKYTKKFMVVPYEEESEQEALKRKEREDDKVLTDIVVGNDPDKYNKYNEAFKKSIFKRKESQQQSNNTEDYQKKFKDELGEINGMINDILENKKKNDDDFYKPTSTQTRSKKQTTVKKKKLEKKTPIKKSKKETMQSRSSTDTAKKPTSKSKKQMEKSLSMDKINNLGGIIETQIMQDKVMTEDEDFKTPDQIERRKSILKKSTGKAPKKDYMKNARESIVNLENTKYPINWDPNNINLFSHPNWEVLDK